MWNKKIFFLFVVLGFVNSIVAQKKEYKHSFAYRVDSVVYDYQSYKSTKRTAHCKEIIINQKRKSRDKWVEDDWFIEKKALLDSKELIIVKHISLTENLLLSKSCEPFLDEKSGTILGPFESDYGQFRFVEITGGSRNLSPLSNGERKISGWLLLEDKNKPKKKIQRIAEEIMTLYHEGVGNKKRVDRRLKRYGKNKAVASDCVCCSKEAKTKQAAAPVGSSWYTINCPSGLAIVRMHKIPANTRYVYYTEYIFK